ncbi:MAG: HD domain-containing protein [Chloroflexota bacterium]
MSSSTVTIDLDTRFQADVFDLLELPELYESRARVHHFNLTEYDHLMGVARNAYRVSRFFRADPRISARAGLLHDLGAHWFNTVKPVALATRLEECHGVRHAIRAHTVLPVLPRTREAWAVVAADFITTAQECHFVYRRFRAGPRAHTRIMNLKRRLSLQSRLSPFKGLRAGPYVRNAARGDMLSLHAGAN